MGNSKIVELIELDLNRRWEYLERFYEITSEFYAHDKRVVSDEEIDQYVRNFKEKPHSVKREEIRLKSWNFQFDGNNEGVRREYYSFDFDERAWTNVSIPHSYRYIPDNPVRFGKFGAMLYGEPNPEHANPAQGNVWRAEYSTWYKKRVPLHSIADDAVVYLCFDSINLLSDVWVNESPVMIDHLGLFPFKMEITEEIESKKGKDAVVAVRVSNIVTNTPFFFYNGFQYSYCNAPYTEGMNNKDWYDEAWAGIADDATLLILNKNHLENVFIITEEISEDRAQLSCRIKLNNTAWERFRGKVKIELSKWLPLEGKVFQLIQEEVSCLPMNDNEIEIGFTLENPELWTIESPNLYLAHCILENENGSVIDDMFETFGVRTIKMKGSNFYLNNKKIVPRGTHNAISYLKESEICPSDRAIVRDIVLHKKMGATCSRWPSDIKMHYKKIAQYCDQLGFMLVWTGFFEVWMVHPELELYAERDAKAMVRALRNCPSIIMWEMGDEPLMLIHDFRRFKWYEQIYNLVGAEDQTRPIVPAGFFSLELVDRILNHKDKSLSKEEKRKSVLQDFPIYTRELAVWDYHYCPEVPPIVPCYTVVDKVKDALGGERPTVFTEFGFDGMPEPTPELVKAYNGKFRWATDAMWGFERKTADLNYFGRELREHDWKEVQACQAIVLSNIIGYLRESPKEFAAFYFMTMFDIWTFYWGLVDISCNPKLAFFIVQNHLQPIYMSGLHGNTILREEDTIDITVSNFEGTMKKALLRVFVKDRNDEVVKSKEFKAVRINGGVRVTKIGQLGMIDSPKDSLRGRSR
jgi:hypothetical protein